MPEYVYVAQVYVPGYLPESDTPGFRTAREAWAYLVSERERDESEYEVYDDALGVLESLARENVDYAAMGLPPRGEWVILAGTPGYAGMHDLGLAYRVTSVRHTDYPHLSGWLDACQACQAMCHCTADSAKCVYQGDHDV